MKNHCWVTILTLFFSISSQAQPHTYKWLEENHNIQSLYSQINTPQGFSRVSLVQNSFGDWLRNLPLKDDTARVRYYNGQLKHTQSLHTAIVDIDVGKRDLQQCADAVMRMRAEYLYSCGLYDSIFFKYTSGDKVSFSRWINGERPSVRGNSVKWTYAHQKGPAYSNFQEYLVNIFSYAGTYSLARDLKSVSPKDIQVGDVFIQGGFPGHAVLVLDICQDTVSGQKLMLIAQSYMPAQSFHILRNLEEPQISPWYRIPEGKLYSPEWTFPAQSLMRFE